MAPVAQEEFQKLLEEIGELEHAVDTAGKVGRDKKDDIDIDRARGEIATGGAFDEQKWQALSEEKRVELAARLTQIRDSLKAILFVDGPRDPDHIMNRSYASNAAIVLIGLVVVALTAGLLYLIVLNWDKATGLNLASSAEALTNAIAELEQAQTAFATAEENKQAAMVGLSATTDATAPAIAEQDVGRAEASLVSLAQTLDQAEAKALEASVGVVGAFKTNASEGTVLLMVVLLGALGGAVHTVGSLAKFVGNRQLMRSWLLYYLSVPLAGAALAPIVYMLLRVGILNPTPSDADGSAISNLNLIAIYAFAALTGMFAKTASDKLAEVFQTIFRTSGPAEKDSLSGNAKPGGGGRTPSP